MKQEFDIYNYMLDNGADHMTLLLKEEKVRFISLCETEDSFIFQDITYMQGTGEAVSQEDVIIPTDVGFGKLFDAQAVPCPGYGMLMEPEKVVAMLKGRRLPHAYTFCAGCGVKDPLVPGGKKVLCVIKPTEKTS